MVIHKVVMRREWRTGLGILGRMLARVVSHGMLAGQTIAVAAMVCVSSPSIHAWMTAMVYGPPACQEHVLVAMQHPACQGLHPGQRTLPH